jgi:hypothetical protein
LRVDAERGGEHRFQRQFSHKRTQRTQKKD